LGERHKNLGKEYITRPMELSSLGGRVGGGSMRKKEGSMALDGVREFEGKLKKVWGGPQVGGLRASKTLSNFITICRRRRWVKLVRQGNEGTGNPKKKRVVGGRGLQWGKKQS